MKKQLKSIIIEFFTLLEVVHYPALLFLFCYAINRYIEHQYLAAFFLMAGFCGLVLWAILFELKGQKKNIKLKFKHNPPLLIGHRVGFQDSEDFKNRSVSGPANLTLRLIRDWMSWSVKTFTKSTMASCVIHLRSEVEELSIEVNSLPRSRDKILKEGVDVILSTISTLARAGITESDIHNGMAAKFAINKDRKWNLNADLTYSHIKAPEAVTEKRIYDLQMKHFDTLPGTKDTMFATQMVLNNLMDGKYTDNEIVEHVHKFYKDNGYGSVTRK